jgi:ankyrin repeat protein
MSATQIALKKMDQKYAPELGQRLLQAIKSYDTHPSTIQRLIALGADCNARDNNGDTALILAARNDKIPLTVFKSLRKAGFPVDAHGSNGNTALMEAVTRGQDSVMKSLDAVQHELDVEGKIKLYSQAEAILCERYDVFTYLMRIYSACVSLCNKKGETALLYALKYGWVHDPFLARHMNDIVIMLINRGHLNVQDCEGNSPLMVAVQNEYTYIVKILLRPSLYLYLKNKQGQTAFDLAEPYPILAQMLHDFEKDLRKKNTLQVSLSFCKCVDTQRELAKKPLTEKGQRLSEHAAMKNSLWLTKRKNQDTTAPLCNDEKKFSENSLEDLKIVVQKVSAAKVTEHDQK